MAQVKFYRGLSTAYVPNSTHKDCIFFATDTNQLMLNGAAYGFSLADAAILKNAITKVEWVSPDTIQFTCGNADSSHQHVVVKLPTATESEVGLMAPAQVTKLKNVEQGAQVNVIESVVVDGVSGNVANKVLTINGGFAKAADVYAKEAAESMVDDKIAAALTAVYEYKGSKATFAELPTEGNKKGDVYNVDEEHDLHPAGTNWVWDGSKWDALGGLVDLSGIEGDIAKNAEDIAKNAEDIANEVDRAEGVEEGLRTDLGNKTDEANENGSAFARIANLASLVSDMTGGSTTSIAQQIADAKSELIGDATEGYRTMGDLEDRIKAEESRAKGEEGALSGAISSEQQRAEAEEARIAGLVAAEQQRAEGIESGLETRLATAEGVIAKLDGADTVAGSVKKQIKDAVAAEAERATGVEGGLDTRIKALEAAVGEDGSVSDAIEAAVAALDANVNSTGGAKVSVNVVEVDGKITSVTVAEDDIASAQALASYKTTNDAAVAAKVATADFEDFKTANTSAIATAKSEAITKAGENADTKISEAINALDASKTGNGTFVGVTVTQTDGKITSVAVSEENIASAALLGALSDDATKNTAFGKAAAAQAAAEAADAKASDNATAIGNLKNNTVNGKKISENPVLAGEDIALTGYSAVTGGFVVATDTVSSAIAKLENDLIWHEA